MYSLIGASNDKACTNFLLHVTNHALKDLYVIKETDYDSLIETNSFLVDDFTNT